MALDQTAGAPREGRRQPLGARAAARDEDIDDIFGDEEPRRAAAGSVQSTTRPSAAATARPSGRSPAGNGGGVASMHVVTPRSFNDAQQVADEFKRSKPVIINLQSTDRELSKRLIDFSSGMTYALGGGMQRISQGIFLLTPENVEVSAEEKARILEGGFFNQS